MLVDQVTRRWAGALFNLAKRGGALDDVGRDVERIGAELRVAAVRAYLFSAQHPREERRAKLAGLLGGFHPLTRNFVNLLFDKHREVVLGDLHLAFRERMHQELGEVEGYVESTRAIEQAELDSIASSLGAKLGKRVLLENRLNPELVGGVRVFVGANMIDSSVQGRMDGLRKQLMDARLPAAHA